MTDATSRVLTDEELDRQLEDLPGVTVADDGQLVVTFRAPTFPEAVRFVQLVAEDAEQLDHHPDIDIRWRTVRFALMTHSAGGVTQRDIELAHVILRTAHDLGARTVEPQSS
jgi:4a-hydroxytetrahydrobiopterin dehydratase